MISFLAGVAFLVVVSVLLNLMSNEAWGWLPYLSRLVVRTAVRRLPKDARERYLEEWSADLAKFEERRIAGLLWALSTLRGSVLMGMRARMVAARRATTAWVGARGGLRTVLRAFRPLLVAVAATPVLLVAGSDPPSPVRVAVVAAAVVALVATSPVSSALWNWLRRRRRGSNARLS